MNNIFLRNRIYRETQEKSAGSNLEYQLSINVRGLSVNIAIYIPPFIHFNGFFETRNRYMTLYATTLCNLIF